ncbi:hypothetical protein SAZ10_04565 [Mesorhizobium sp. BAC0120]|uniref:hypothetical protein n=1 Tax=Mesorhizobium sp. BAC0120 TaxID=3090670 RepID=UPI00298D4012|nr:hypothetical protein [Mesorhizobium sp. BAC0120]MDW6021032.1 hypothetical protein [Mesorhizobium sp. BAC0120]
MPFRDIADAEERVILTTALFEYCREHRIDPSSPEYEDARRLMVLLFENHGLYTVADLKAALVAAIRREQ